MISVVTINLNNKIGLEKSICSMINQTCFDEIEYIVVDGGSNDGSIELIEEFKKYIDNVLVEKDSGIFDAMNKGIQLATKKYLYFLNSGDVFNNENTLKNVIGEINRNDLSSSIYCGKVISVFGERSIGSLPLFPWIPHQGAFVSTEMMKRYMFDSSLKIYGDLDLWKRMSVDGIYNPEFINEIIANMPLDGVGNDPEFIHKRLVDKANYLRKHEEKGSLRLTYLLEYSKLVVYKIFGKKIYWLYFIPFLLRIRVLVKKIVL